MATHFSILSWEIPWTEEPGKELQRIGHDLVTKKQQHVNEITPYFFIVWLLSLSITPSRSIHIVAMARFFYVAE